MLGVMRVLMVEDDRMIGDSLRHALRLALLSMVATVDVAEQQGAALTAATIVPRSSSSTDVFKAGSAAADQRVRQIINAQLGKAVRG